MKKRTIRGLIRDVLIEAVLYGIVIVAYFFVVLQYLGDWLQQIFQNNLIYYAFVSLGLILVQGAFLDTVTTFLLNHLRLERLE